ncbi:hypothetical protein [Acetobacter sp.]
MRGTLESMVSGHHAAQLADLLPIKLTGQN